HSSAASPPPWSSLVDPNQSTSRTWRWCWTRTASPGASWKRRSFPQPSPRTIQCNRKVTTMREVVICEPVRTAIGGYGGMFKSLTATELGVTALVGLMERTGLDPDQVEDVILGHAYPTPEAPAIGRVVAMDAGLPVTVGGQQVDRRCGSGFQALVNAVLQVASGGND